MSDVAPRLAARSIPLFDHTELRTLIDTSHQYGVKIAAHAKTAPVVKALLELGVDSVEHGSEIYSSKEVLRMLANPDYHKTVWVPTLAVYYTMAQRGIGSDQWEAVKKSFKAALGMGIENVRIACGGDTGTFAHGDNALEMQLMYQLGASWQWVLRWGTLGGWECIRGMEGLGHGESDNEVAFGCLRKGWAADLVGLEGDLEHDFEATIRRPAFVMKGGKIFKQGGREST